MQSWRLFDSGLRKAAENMALDKSLLEGVGEEGRTVPTLRFLQFQPCALVGYHQSVKQELNEAYCQEHGIDIQRRVTGGGAIFFDPPQLGWTLYFPKNLLGVAEMTALSEKICNAAADGLQELGVDAQFRPRNDIEVAGKKISGTGGALDGSGAMYQGTVLVDFDVERMLHTLRIPMEKLSAHGIAAAKERVTCLRSLLGEAPPLDTVKSALQSSFSRAFEVEWEPGSLTEEEQRAYTEALQEVEGEDWLALVDRGRDEAPMMAGLFKAPGGLIRMHAMVDTFKNRLMQIQITGDFFIQPRRTVADLEAALRNSALDDVANGMRSFFLGREVDMLGLTVDDFVTAWEHTLNA